MQGIELCRGFYEAYGAPMLHEQFPQYEEIIAVGLVGAGSECFGYDDEVSRDHDFEPAFCLFLPDEEVIDRRTAFLLERAYAKLPKEYGGVPRLRVSPVGGSRHGVLRMEDFFREKIGHSGKITDLMDWFPSPSRDLPRRQTVRCSATMWGFSPPSATRCGISRPMCAKRSLRAGCCSWRSRGSTIMPAASRTGSLPPRSLPSRNLSAIRFRQFSC